MCREKNELLPGKINRSILTELHTGTRGYRNITGEELVMIFPRVKLAVRFQRDKFFQPGDSFII